MSCKIMGCPLAPIGIDLAKKLFEGSEKEILEYSKYCTEHVMGRRDADLKNQEMKRQELEEENE